MERETLKLQNEIKLLKELVVFAVVINLKFLLIKRVEQKTLLKTQSAHMGIDQLWVVQHGVI